MAIVDPDFDMAALDRPPQDFVKIATQQGQIWWLAKFIVAINNVFDDVNATITTLPEGSSPTVDVTFDNDQASFDFKIPVITGEPGQAGQPGADGVGIENIVFNSDYTMTITTTDGDTYTSQSLRGETGATGATGAQGATGATGATGNGISNIVFNADYTMTITTTDGNTWTSGSLRGPQGEQGPAGSGGGGVYIATASSTTSSVWSITVPDFDANTKSLIIASSPYTSSNDRPTQISINGGTAIPLKYAQLGDSQSLNINMKLTWQGLFTLVYDGSKVIVSNFIYTYSNSIYPSITVSEFSSDTNAVNNNLFGMESNGLSNNQLLLIKFGGGCSRGYFTVNGVTPVYKNNYMGSSNKLYIPANTTVFVVNRNSQCVVLGAVYPDSITQPFDFSTLDITPETGIDLTPVMTEQDGRVIYTEMQVLNLSGSAWAPSAGRSIKLGSIDGDFYTLTGTAYSAEADTNFIVSFPMNNETITSRDIRVTHCMNGLSIDDDAEICKIDIWGILS